MCTRYLFHRGKTPMHLLRKKPSFLEFWYGLGAIVLEQLSLLLSLRRIWSASPPVYPRDFVMLNINPRNPALPSRHADRINITEAARPGPTIRTVGCHPTLFVI